MRRVLGVLLLGTVLIAATPTAFGGWAVVTLLDVPEYLVAGEETTIAFKIRQHGRQLLDDRQPTVALRDGEEGFLSKLFRLRTVRATPGADPTIYQASITPTDTGEVTLHIDTDLFRWKVKLLPMRVIAAGHQPAGLSPPDRGQQLFAAKGCATCHTKYDDPAFADYRVVQAGPGLGERTFPAGWLAQKLANPALSRSGSANGNIMPTLELDEEEIAALVSYINGGRTTVETGDR